MAFKSVPGSTVVPTGMRTRSREPTVASDPTPRSAASRGVLSIRWSPNMTGWPSGQVARCRLRIARIVRADVQVACQRVAHTFGGNPDTRSKIAPGPPCVRYPPPMNLLGPLDPHPVRVSNPEGASPFLLVSDHAGRRRPDCLGDLGVARADWDRHVAFDLGIKGVGASLARRLDAVLIEQRYSRLVIDCNRAPGHPASVPARSERTLVPANAGLRDDDRRRREQEILEPYHQAIAAALRRRQADGRRTVLVALHSFTPEYDGVARPWAAGVLHDGRSAFPLAVLSALSGAVGELARSGHALLVGDNEPYRLDPASDYTVPRHAWTSGLDHVEIEIRQDLVAGTDGQARWAGVLERALGEAEGRRAAR